jgi:hypothetical protein
MTHPRTPPGSVLIELTGPGPRDGERHRCTPHVLAVGLNLPEIDTAPPTTYADPWAALDLAFRYVAWEWDGREPVGGVYRFHRR